MTFFPVEHQVDPLADVLGHRDFGLVVEKLEHLVLFWRDVHGGGDLLPCHDGTMHDHTSTVNPVYNYSILLIVFFGPSLSRMTLRDVSSSGCTEVVFRKVMVLAFLWAGAWFGSMGCGSSTSAGSPGARSDLKLTQSDFGAQFDRSRCNDQGKQVITADTNGDGKPDVVLGPSEGKGRLSWFENPTWREHVIDPGPLEGAHSLGVADFDGDGRLEVMAGEMHTSPGKRVLVYRRGPTGDQWQRLVVATTGTHNAQVGRLTPGGLPAIVGKNYEGPKQVEVWQAVLTPVPREHW